MLGSSIAPFEWFRVATRCLVMAAGALLWATSVMAQPLALMVQHSDEVGDTAFAFVPGTSKVVSGGSAIRVWDLSTRRILARFEFRDLEDARHSVADTVNVSTDGRWLVATVRTLTIVWDLPTGRRVQVLGSRGAVSHYFSGAAVSRDGTRVWTSDDIDGGVSIWDVHSGQVIRTLEHPTGVEGISLSADERFLLTRDDENTVRVWDLRTHRLQRQIERANGLDSVALSPDGNWVVTADADGSLRLWNVANGRSTDVRPTGSPVSALAWSPDGRSVAVAATDPANVVTINLDESTAQGRIALDDDAEAVLYSPDGQFLLTADGFSGQLWFAESKEFLGEFETRTTWLEGATFSRDGRELVLIGDSMLRWNFVDGSVLASDRRKVGPPVYSPDGQVVITGGGREEPGKVRDAKTWEVRYELSGRAPTPRLSADGNVLMSIELSGRDASVVTLFAVATGLPTASFQVEGHVVDGVVDPVRGQVILAVRPRRSVRRATLQVRTIPEGSLVEEVRSQHSVLSSLVLSRDGARIATGGLDGIDSAAAVWTRAPLVPLQSFVVKGAFQELNSIHFSPDGQHLVTNLGVWERSSGNRVLSFPDHTSFVATNSDFSVAAVGIGAGSGLVQLLDIRTGTELGRLFSFQGYPNDRAEDQGWAVLSPTGHFDAADPVRLPHMHWVRSDEVVLPSDLNTKRFYVPSLVTQLLCPYLKERECVPLPSVDSLQNVTLPPSVLVRAPVAGSTEARATVVDRGGGIGAIVVRVNGRELPTTRGIRLASVGGGRELIIDLSSATLDPTGVNHIAVAVYNAEGTVKSRPATAQWTTAPQARPAPRFWGVVVGVSGYADPNLRLRFAAKDATDVAAAMRLGAGRLFGEDRTDVRLIATGSAQHPTRAAVEAAFQAVAAQAGPDDVLFVYLAGHAVSWESTYYFLTQDARGLDVGLDDELRNTATISSEALAGWLTARGIPRKVVVVLDTCEAGAAGRDLARLAEQRNVSADQRRALEILRQADDSYHFLMGSAAGRVSYEASRYGQGLLTYALLLGLRGAALESSGHVDVRRLFDFAQQRVPDLARGIGGIQKPEIRSPMGASFPIGTLSAGDRASIPLAVAKPVLVRALAGTEQLVDPLRLASRLREELRSASDPVSRGGARREPQVVYLDEVTEDMADGLSPRVPYRLSGTQIEARVQLIRDEKIVFEELLVLEASDPELATKIVAVLIKAAVSQQ